MHSHIHDIQLWVHLSDYFLIHKYFDYYFAEKGQSKNQQLNDYKNNESEVVQIKQIENEVIKEKFSIEIQNTIESEVQEGKQESVINKKVELKKIIFQFTYFCQFFCPLMNNEFKNKPLENRKPFSIPNHCYDHILLGNLNLQKFYNSMEEKIPIDSIFTDNTLKEKFLDFIKEKELSKIDKICHFSCTIILSENRHLIEDESIMNFIKDLDITYF